MESVEHKTIKDMVYNKLQEWFGASLPEYPSSGHELDVFAVTPDGISIGVEVIWSPTESNFYRCLNLIQQSDACIKIVIANPKIISNPKYQREFSKAAIAQRKTDVLIYGELIDGQRILKDRMFIETELKDILFDLVQKAPRGLMKKTIEISLPEIPKPDKIREQLIPNLLPVKSYPSEIFNAPTDLKTEPEAFRKLGPTIQTTPPLAYSHY